MKPYLHKVQYYETDMMGVAHHANYIHWMEEARIDLMDQLGFPYSEMERKGIFSPVRALSCEYKHPCTFGDEISVTVSIDSFNGVIMAIVYEMKNQNGQTICKAHSEHVFLTRSLTSTPCSPSPAAFSSSQSRRHSQSVRRLRR